MQGSGEDWYFDLDYLTDHLGYVRFKANNTAGTQDAHPKEKPTSADSEDDDHPMVIPSFTTDPISGNMGKDLVIPADGDASFAEDLARL